MFNTRNALEKSISVGWSNNLGKSGEQSPKSLEVSGSSGGNPRRCGVFTDFFQRIHIFRHM